jgi:cytochrome P450
MSGPISISNDIGKKTFSSNAHPPINDLKSKINFTDLDVFTQGQPFEHFKKMREEAPVFLHPPFFNDPEPGFWSLTRHEDILKVSSDPKTFSSQAGTGTMITLGREDRRHPKLWRSAVDHMLNLDGDMHINLRREHMPFFKPNYVSDLRIKVQAKVTSLLDAIDTSQDCNFVTAFSQQLPIFTLSEILGIPESDRPKLGWSF